MAEFSSCSNVQPECSREKFFSYKWYSARITIKNSFGTLKTRFRCLQRAMDISINTLSQFLYLCLELNNYFELQKEKIPEQSLLSFKRFLNEKKATDIANTFTLLFE